MSERLEIVISAVDRATGTLNAVGKALAAQREELRGLNVLADEFSARGKRQAVVAAGMGAALAAAVRPSMDFEQGMRNVNSIAKLTEAEFQKLRATTLQVARDKQITDLPGTLARGLYDINSSGLAGAVALDTLAIASKGAAAGQSDAATAARVLVGTMNAYGKTTGKDAARIMDILFRTVDRGVITFGELAQSFGAVVATGASVGVTVEEMGAAISTMTKRGIIPAEAVTSLNQVLMQFLSPGKAFAATMKEWGYTSGLQILQQRGLAGSMEWLTQATGGQADKMVQMLGEVRAARGAMSLTGTGARMFAEDLTAMQNSAGAMGAALKEQEKGPMFQWKAMLKDLSIAAVEFGKAILPILRQVTDRVRQAAEWFGKLPEGTQKLIVETALGATAFTALSAGANMAAGGVLGIIARIGELRGLGGTIKRLAEEAGAKGAGGGMTRLAGGIDTVRSAFGRATDAARVGWKELQGPRALPHWRNTLGIERTLTQPVMAAKPYVTGQGAGYFSPLYGPAGGPGIGGATRMGAIDWAASLANLRQELQGTGRYWEWLRERVKTSWSSQWAATVSNAGGIGGMLKGLFGNLKTGAMGAFTWLKALPGAIVAVGKALITFFLSPVGAVILALGVMVASLARTYGMWKEMRSAQKEAEDAKKAEAAATKESQDKGYINEAQVARRLGYTQEQIDAGLTGDDQKRVHAEFLRLRAKRRQEQKAAASAADPNAGQQMLGTVFGTGEAAPAASEQTTHEKYLALLKRRREEREAQAVEDEESGVASDPVHEQYTDLMKQRKREREMAALDVADAAPRFSAMSDNELAAQEQQQGSFSDAEMEAWDDEMKRRGWTKGSSRGGQAGTVTRAPAPEGSKVLSLTIYVRDKEETLRIVGEQLDKAFAM